MKFLSDIDWKNILKVENWRIELLTSLSIVLTVILMVPDSFNTSIKSFTGKYGDWVLLIDIILITLIGTYCFTSIKNKNKTKKNRLSRIDWLKSLNEEHTTILRNILTDSNETIVLDQNDGLTYYLLQNGVITMTGSQYAVDVGYNGEIYCRFTISQSVRKLIYEEENLKKKFLNV